MSVPMILPSGREMLRIAVPFLSHGAETMGKQTFNLVVTANTDTDEQEFRYQNLHLSTVETIVEDYLVRVQSETYTSVVFVIN